MPSSLSARADALLAPPPAAARVALLTPGPFAHRGLHGGAVIENSRAAFTAAIAAGHGIECDVQLAADQVAMVFHDDRLDRLTDATGALIDRAAAALATIRLKGTDEGIPRLDEMLAIVAGRVPLLIEIKAKDRAAAPVCRAVRRAVEGYAGRFAVMSFNPEVGHWFRVHAPGIVRGLVVTEAHKRGLRGRIERHLSLWRARPDFLAYDVRDFPSRFAAAQRARGLPVLTWTVRGVEAEQVAAHHADAIIYETPRA
jgi:glycerophosphoryl diester phosphodiesterase